MGWWGTGIMQGDRPLDILGSLSDKLPGVAPVDQDGDAYWHPEGLVTDAGMRERFAAALDAFWPHAERWIQAMGSDAGLAAQVLGVCAMAAGCDIDRPLDPSKPWFRERP